MSGDADANAPGAPGGGGADPAAASSAELLPLVYEELRVLSERYLRRERPDHTLQATALVHEAYLRLSAGDERRWNDRAHFVRVASRAMRRVLINHAQQRRAIKRGEGRPALALQEVTLLEPDRTVDLLALDEALDDLAARDEQKADVVELRFFGGCTIEDAAAFLGLSHATVERDWRFARAWLRDRLLG